MQEMLVGLLIGLFTLGPSVVYPAGDVVQCGGEELGPDRPNSIPASSIICFCDHGLTQRL